MSSSRSNNRPACSRGSSARSKHSERVVAQTPVDARLHAEFEGSHRHFDYSSSVSALNRSGASTSSALMIPVDSSSAHLPLRVAESPAPPLLTVAR